jgi:hypothetical protein
MWRGFSFLIGGVSCLLKKKERTQFLNRFISEYCHLGFMKSVVITPPTVKA